MGGVKTRTLLKNQSTLTDMYVLVNRVGEIEYNALRKPKKQSKI